MTLWAVPEGVSMIFTAGQVLDDQIDTAPDILACVAFRRGSCPTGADGETIQRPFIMHLRLPPCITCTMCRRRKLRRPRCAVGGELDAHARWVTGRPSLAASLSEDLYLKLSLYSL